MKKLILVATALLCVVTAFSQSNFKEKTVFKNDDVEIRQLDAHTWHGNGHRVFNESIYLIEGEHSALLIDAGTIMPGLKKIVEAIVKKPVILAISHGHGDHTGDINEWDSLWINAADMAIIPQNAYKGVVQYLTDGQVFDLGGREIEVVFTPGHTPGSTTFIDREAHYGFSSDAFGSGNLLVFTDLSTQWASCLRFSRFMEKYGITHLYPGHYWGDNLETQQRVKDVATICDGVLNGTLTPERGTNASLPYVVDKYGVKVNFGDKQIRADIQTSEQEWGIQLYSLRTMIGSPELYKANHDRVFSTLADYGFTQAELYGYEDGKIFGIPAAEFVADVRNAGITPVSSHVQYALTDEEIRSGDFSGKQKWWKDCIAEHKKIGVRNIVYVWYALPTSMLELQRIAEYLNWIGEMCRKEGISFGYHNHDHELKAVEGKEVMLDYLLAHTNPDNVFIEMDVYWTVYGNGSPVDYFTRYPGRFKILHIKDKYEIGQSGMVGFDAIFKHAKQSGANFLIVEQETTQKKDMLESLRISMEYLKSIPSPGVDSKSAYEVGPYTVEEIEKNVFHIQDFNRQNPSGETFNVNGEKTHFNNCSDMYLLVGNREALLIDLSNYIKWDDTAIESLRKLVAEKTGKKPLTITFTHNHGDHTGMLAAFDKDPDVRFALPRIDFKSLKSKFPKGQYTFFDEGKSFDLGGMSVNTLLVPGHTHGSMVFFLEGHDIVFTGDAIGSGHGVWIFNTEGFKEYTMAIPRFINYIENPKNGICPENLIIMGGHYWQKDWFVGTGHPDIDWQYVKDMQELVTQISNGTAFSEPSNLGHKTLDTYFKYNNAIIVWNKDQAKVWQNK